MNAPVAEPFAEDEQLQKVAAAVRPEPAGGATAPTPTLEQRDAASLTSSPVAPAPESAQDPAATPTSDARAREREQLARRWDDEEPAWQGRRLPGPAGKPRARTVGESLQSLPILTPVEKARYGFERLTVNMVKPKSETNPQGSAIMTVEELESDGSVRRNTVPFYEGQRIRGSSLRLFKVEQQGIGLEDVRTGERFHVPF